MNYEQFQKLLAEEVRRQSQGRVVVRPQKLSRNNGVTVDALEIRGAEEKITPAIYMDSLYEQYLRGVSVVHLARLALEQYQEFREKSRFPADFFKEYPAVADSIYCKVIHRGKNLELLQEVPWQPWMDLAVVYYYQVEEGLIVGATILIRNSHLQRWKITASQLREKAWANTLEKLPPVMQKLSQVLRQWGELQEVDEALLDGNPLYLLTNRKKCLGAVCICYPGQAGRIADILGADFYVLPSSIHECLILPSTGRYSPEELQEMVRTINRTQLQPQEVLSDCIYYYDRTLRRLELGVPGGSQ